MTSQELTQELTQLFALGYGFLLLCGAIYAIVWAFALLALILNGSRLAKAGARWRDADRELTARLAKIPTYRPPAHARDNRS